MVMLVFAGAAACPATCGRADAGSEGGGADPGQVETGPVGHGKFAVAVVDATDDEHWRTVSLQVLELECAQHGRGMEV